MPRRVQYGPKQKQTTFDFHSGKNNFFLIKNKLKLIIHRKHDQCFPSLSYFADLFHKHLGELNNSKMEKRGKYWPYCAG